MPRQSYRVTTADMADTDPATWWECQAHSATDAAEDYVEDDAPGEDSEYLLVVLTPDGKRLRFCVDVAIVRHYDVSRLED